MLDAGERFFLFDMTEVSYMDSAGLGAVVSCAKRAREKSDEGWPVIVFFDEMDSMFRTRGSGISSDMESTIVPQLLSEIDGVEGLKNVIVIGATNREDLIDPAILRPGRLDVKIKIERPNAEAATAIFARYLTDEIPIMDGEAIPDMIEATVAEMYREMFAGLHADPAKHLHVTFPESYDEMVLVRDITFTSMCEHHLLPFTGVAHVAYLPSHGKVTGLSKLARTVDVFARRPQLQEQLTGQIADALVEHLDPRGVAVVVQAEHSCLKLRGARKSETEMVTTAFRGELRWDRDLRREVLGLIRGV